MRLLALLSFPVSWFGVGLGVYTLTGNWDRSSFAYLELHALGIAFLLVAPFILWSLAGISQALKIMTMSTAELAKLKAFPRTQNCPRSR